MTADVIICPQPSKSLGLGRFAMQNLAHDWRYYGLCEVVLASGLVVTVGLIEYKHSARRFEIPNRTGLEPTGWPTRDLLVVEDSHGQALWSAE